MLESNPYVRLLDGNSMPLIALGTMNIKQNDKTFNLTDFLTNAINTGYTHLDLSKSFENEVQIGQALKVIFQQKIQVFNLQGEPIQGQFQPFCARQNIFLSLKVSNTKNKPIVQQLKEALLNFKTDYIDLLVLNYTFSPTLSTTSAEEEDQKPTQQMNYFPIHQAWKQMQQCKNLNLCKSIGVANFSISSLLNLIPFTNNVPVVNQVQSHPWNIQKKMYQFLKKYGIIMGAYCPLARGGKDQKVVLGQKIDYQNDATLKQLSEKYSKNIFQLMLNYQLVRGVYVCPKTQKIDHLKDNFNITDFELQQQDRQIIEGLSGGNALRVYQPKQLPFWKGIDPLC